jgi:hypothetical protein
VHGRKYTSNYVKDALIEHVKDINHQLSVKIGKEHDREGFDIAAALLSAKSQALTGLAILMASDKKE